MRKVLFFLILIIATSCGRQSTNQGEKIITVSIAPFKYFIEAIADNDFVVNVMVPAGSDPHVYEPFPEQIAKLRKSVGYISNGYLGFEMNWLDRFYETNRFMKKLSLGDNIDPIAGEHHHEGEQQHGGEHIEGADPHYWVSPVCAAIIAHDVRDFLILLNPAGSTKYETNYQILLGKIQDLDKRARELFGSVQNKSVMIYHPNLAYIARDYGLTEIPVEFEGKEPSPSRLRELIDLARKDNLKTVFVQREYDKKNANAIADEIGAVLKIIDPLSEDWLTATSDIINSLYKSLIESIN
jgi:zinc transport system substrate-binding protein